MPNEVNEIALRLRELREVCDYTIEDLASELGIAPEVYAAYEENGKDIPISLIYEIANKFKVDFAEIVTGIPARLNSYHIVKRGGGMVVNRNPEYHFEDLAYKYYGKVMQPLLVTLQPTDKPAGLISHSGQEFNMVLEVQLSSPTARRNSPLLQVTPSILTLPPLTARDAAVM